MPVVIIYPQCGMTIKTPLNRSRFPVSGYADSSVTGLAWKCELKGDPSVRGQVNSFVFFPVNDGEGMRMRWSITVCVPQDGEYTLQVAGHTASGDTDPQTVEFKVESESPVIRITWPEKSTSSIPIDDYLSAFAPYGFLDSHQIGTATLTGQSHGEITRMSIYGDPYDGQYWTAQFDTIPSETDTYELFVEDNIGSSQDDIPNLTVS